MPQFDELLQLAVIELIRKDCKGHSGNKAKYIRCIFELLNSPSHSVKYEAATSLVSLVNSKMAVTAAASCYISLILAVSDNNVKLIVLDRLAELHAKHSSERLLEDLVMDILWVLASPDIGVRRKSLNIAMDMVSARNVTDVVGFLKKELVKTVDGGYEKNAEYRQLLIQSIHSCAIKFPQVASSVVHVLMEFIGDSNNSSAVDVVSFVREVVEKFPDLRSGITERLLGTFGEMKSGKVFRGALWIVGEYSADEKGIEEAWKQIRASLGEVPILAAEQRMLDAAEQGAEDVSSPSASAAAAVPSSTAAPRRVLADGTYATESAFSSTSTQKISRLDAVKAAQKPPLRSIILGGDFYVAAVLATTLTKLVIRYMDLSTSSANHRKHANAMRAEGMLMMTSLLRVGASQFASTPIDQDSHDRILNCLRILASMSQTFKSVFLDECKAAFTKMVQAEDKKMEEKKKKADKVIKVQVDDALVWRQFSKRTVGGEGDEYEVDLNRATGVSDSNDDLISKLSRVVPLTGFSDPVFAEAYVNVHQYDILMDVLIVNQTSETLQNLAIEFATLGDLKLVERPATTNLAAHSFHTVKVNIKVSSTETGVIFGNIVYDGPGVSETSLVTLNDIHIDIMDYISPAYCNEQQFRSMWTEFEWENKVNVNTNITDSREYLDHIMKSTNMSCLTPETALLGDCGILSANMYARSIFGEDALANLSVEKQSGGPITGHIRIRSKTQGIALSLGDKITLAQKIQKK